MYTSWFLNYSELVLLRIYAQQSVVFRHWLWNVYILCKSELHTILQSVSLQSEFMEVLYKSEFVLVQQLT